VLGACVESLARSPGNWTGVCGLTEGEALLEVVAGDAPVDVSVDPSADEVGKVNGSVPVVALAVPGLVCVALGDVKIVDVPVVPTAFDEAFICEDDGCEDDGALTGVPVWELVCACAAPDATSHRIVAKMNGRRITLSVRTAEQNAWRSAAFPN
jgi:hypothetical protein